MSVVALDHLIPPLNDREASLAFHTETLGFAYAGERPPFAVVRANESTNLQLAPWGREGNQRLAFAMSRAGFEAMLARVRAAGIACGERAGRSRSAGTI